MLGPGLSVDPGCWEDDGLHERRRISLLWLHANTSYVAFQNPSRRQNPGLYASSVSRIPVHLQKLHDFACISCPVPHLIQFAAPLESKEIPAQHAKNTTFALRRLLLWYQCVPTVCGMTSCVVIRGHVQWGMTDGSCRKKSCQHKSVENSRMQIPGSFLVFVPQISTIHHGNRLESNALHPGK